MKTIPPACPEPETGARYWRSLDQLAETPQFRQWVEREFPEGASEFTDPTSRRHFVKIMSASFLLAGLGGIATGCRRPEERILPFGKAPESYVHGVPQFFATSMPYRGTAIPLVARSNDGRPTKVEGNDLLAEHGGGTDLYAQASILNLYDPDRAVHYRKAGKTEKRSAALDFLSAVGQKAGASKGAGLAFLLDRSSSPSRARVQAEIAARLPQARWFSHEAVDTTVFAAAGRAVFGSSVTPYHRLERAQRILSLDCDFIGTEDDAQRQIRGLAAGRRLHKASDNPNRLYVVESVMSLTGVSADQRLRATPSEVSAVGARLALEILSATGSMGSLQASLQKLAAGIPKGSEKWIVECARDLVAHKGHAVVLAGQRQPVGIHALSLVLNVALGGVGHTVELLPVPASADGSITDLAAALNAGQVETLVIVNANPAYTAGVDLDWARTQRKAGTVVRLGYYEEETGALADWHYPGTHYLETWGDARISDGTLVPVQPLIAPLFEGISELEFLARIGGLTETRAHAIVRETFRSVVGSGDFEEQWKRFLHDGFLAGSGSAPAAVGAPDLGSVSGLLASVPAASGKLEVLFQKDGKVDDGRYNNNGWLQELPDPVTKMVWDNVIAMSKATADKFGLVIVDKEDNDLQVPVVRITVDGHSVEGPAWIQPGMADNVVALSLGYGRSIGRIGTGAGYNAYAIRGSRAPWIATGDLAPANRLYPLSTTQNHGAMEGRPIIREANLEQYRKNPHFASGMNMHEPPGPRGADGQPEPLYPNPLDVAGVDGKTPRERATHAWGMSIDLNLCVGCSSCMMACQSENNIPIVGKDQVSRNREMHWIRLDRYYTSTRPNDVSDPQVVVQPMLCQHCESAPCESVCPVNATAHDEEGLNIMAYNRCVGTRYCSNNCPYKVRRFNYLDYNKRPLELLKGPVYTMPLLHSTDGELDVVRWWKNPDRGIRPDDEWELLKLVKNPDVTVRMRGVMEKCTFCLQRIEQAKIKQKVKAGASADVEVKDGGIKTACQQACPAGAILFGNLKDPESEVSRAKRLDRDYTVLEFLATKPRTTYLARVRNPNPAITSDYSEAPGSFKEWEAKGNALAEHGAHGGHEAGSSVHGAGHETGKKGAH